MSVFVGQLLVFLKIGSIAFAIMAVLWLLIRFVEKRGREKVRHGADQTGS